jgi:adenine deaminase
MKVNLNLDALISVAKGDEPADLLFKNARIINTFNGVIEKNNVAIYQDTIAGIGDYTRASKIIDLKGAYLAPGLINGHTHIESSMLHPVGYAQAVVTRGTTSVVTDLHEIANVLGREGIDFILSWMKKLPLDVFLMAPSCVPATTMETSGASLNEEDLEDILKLPNVLGLGEMMNFPGVIFRDSKVLAKISKAQNEIVDGHAPGISNKSLNAYIAAGIYSDHECTRLDEAREKLARGMYIMIREGSSEKNLDELLPLVMDQTSRRCLFVVDDRTCSDLLRKGDIDWVARKAISRGLDPIRAIQMVTINPAEYFRLHDRGAIAPGFLANLVTITDLPKFSIDQVIFKGQLVASEGKYLFCSPEFKSELPQSMHIKSFDVNRLRFHTDKESYPVIEVVPGQIITKKRIEKLKKTNSFVEADLERDILKAVVVERHKSTGNIGVGLVKGFGLKKGAIASSVAHDSHNIICVGTTDNDIYAAVKEIERIGGGLTVCLGGAIVCSLALPIAGLLSAEPLNQVVEKMEKVEASASSLGSLPPAPFSLLSFLALPVIPELRLTDKGLIDVAEFRIIG